jgi:TonB family protein
MTPPKPIQIANPEFSELARKKKLGGDVMVVLTVDADGMPQNVRVARSLADKVAPKDRKAALSLDEKAIEAVQKYRFKPATRDGNPVAAEIHIDVNFQIF